MFQPDAFQNNAFQTAVVVATVLFFTLRTTAQFPDTDIYTVAVKPSAISTVIILEPAISTGAVFESATLQTTVVYDAGY